MSQMNSPVFEHPPEEEIINAITHGLGVALSIAALVLLVTFGALRGTAWHVVSFAIYGSTLILLYTASTLYHAFRSERLKRLFKIFDHAAIYLLIAGTYTPLTLVNLRGGWGWTLFGVIWGLAVFGVISKALTGAGFEKLSIGLYLLMGWLILVAAVPLVSALSFGGWVWLILGGLGYSFGVIFYVWKKLPFNHAIWHLFVLAASICHFFAIFFHVLPANPL